MWPECLDTDINILSTEKLLVVVCPQAATVKGDGDHGNRGKSGAKAAKLPENKNN